MLASLGVDIIEIDRVRQALRRQPRLANKLFTPAERAYCERRADSAPHYAARFAAKEATAKAIGRPLRWHDVEVVVDPTGRPHLNLRATAAELSRAGRGGRLLLSLSHSRDYAVASVGLLLPEEAGPEPAEATGPEEVSQ